MTSFSKYSLGCYILAIIIYVSGATFLEKWILGTIFFDLIFWVSIILVPVGLVFGLISQTKEGVSSWWGFLLVILGSMLLLPIAFLSAWSISPYAPFESAFITLVALLLVISSIIYKITRIVLRRS